MSTWSSKEYPVTAMHILRSCINKRILVTCQGYQHEIRGTLIDTYADSVYITVDEAADGREHNIYIMAASIITMEVLDG